MDSWLSDPREHNISVQFEPPVCGGLLKRPPDTRGNSERLVRKEVAWRAGGRLLGAGGAFSRIPCHLRVLGTKYKQIEKQLGFAFTVGRFHEEEA